MNKTYKAKKIRNLHDLHLEQARVKQAYRNMEQNAVSSVITPDAVLSLVLNNIVAPKSKKKASQNPQQKKSKSLFGLFRKKKKTAKQAIKDLVALPEKKKKSYKKLGRSLLIWQSASLALFVGVNIFLYYKKKKAQTTRPGKNKNASHAKP